MASSSLGTCSAKIVFKIDYYNMFMIQDLYSVPKHCHHDCVVHIELNITTEMRLHNVASPHATQLSQSLGKVLITHSSEYLTIRTINTTTVESRQNARLWTIGSFL